MWKSGIYKPLAKEELEQSGISDLKWHFNYTIDLLEIALKENEAPDWQEILNSIHEIHHELSEIQKQVATYRISRLIYKIHEVR